MDEPVDLSVFVQILIINIENLSTGYFNILSILDIPERKIKKINDNFSATFS